MLNANRLILESRGAGDPFPGAYRRMAQVNLIGPSPTANLAGVVEEILPELSGVPPVFCWPRGGRHL